MHISLSKIFRHPPRLSLVTERERYPERDWFVGIALAVGVFVVAASYAGWLFFFGVHAIGAPEVPLSDTSISYDKERVAGILEEYESRRAHFERLRYTTSAIPPVTPDAEEAAAPADVPVAETP